MSSSIWLPVNCPALHLSHISKMKPPNNRWRGPRCSCGLAPRALGDSVRPRRLLGRIGGAWRASFDRGAACDLVRPLNFTVRRRMVVTLDMLAFFLALVLASVVVALAATSILGGPYAPLRAVLLPLLWFGSREWRTPFGEFRRRETLTRQAWLGAWYVTFLLAFLVLALTLPRRGSG